MRRFDFILQLKSIEIFVIIIAGGFLKEINFEGLPFLTAILTTTGMVILCGWPVYVGHRLYNYFPGVSKMKYIIFTLCSLIWILAAVLFSLIPAFTNLSFGEVVTIPGVIFILLTGIYCTFFTANMLETVEAGKEVSAGESLGSLLLLTILPIGVWFFQPMIRKAIEGKLHEPGIQQ